MARFLAIDWDDTECRYASATLQKDKIILHNVGVVPIEADNSELPFASLSLSILSCSREEKIASCPLLISLGRNEVEWLPLKLPPCKESEIPLLLRNQVLREISGSTELDLIDYLLLESSSEGNQVLTLTIPRTLQTSLTRTFRSLGHPPLHIGFRATNSAELVLQNRALLNGEPSEPQLIVNIVGNDADLVIITKGRISAIRSFRLPTEHQQKNLADEIERTMTIGLEGTGLLPIRHIVLFGDGRETELPKHLSQSGLKVQFLNPFTLPNISAPNAIPNPEKFASLVGSLLIQSRKTKPAIDFLHPKEAPKPIDYTRPALLGLVLLGMICFGLYYWNQGVLNSLKEQLATVQEEYQMVSSELQQLTPSWNTLRYTNLWETQHVIWLDILKDLSEVLHGNMDLVAIQMTFTTTDNNQRFSGSISLSGMVRDPSVLQKLQQDLHQSRRYLMQNPEQTPNPANGGYPWLFRTTVYRLR